MEKITRRQKWKSLGTLLKPWNSLALLYQASCRWSWPPWTSPGGKKPAFGLPRFFRAALVVALWNLRNFSNPLSGSSGILPAHGHAFFLPEIGFLIHGYFD